jgi:hypothetical protein
MIGGSMGVRTTEGESVVALFDSVSGFAFGPTFGDADEAEAFVRFAERETDGTDLRRMPDDELAALASRFHVEEWADE